MNAHTKLPSGLKLHIIKTTGRSYYEITRVLNGTSSDMELISRVAQILKEYNDRMDELDNEIERAQ